MLSDKIQLKTPLRVSWDLREVTELDDDLLARYQRVKASFLFEFNLIINGVLLQNGNGEFWENNRRSFPDVNLVITGGFDPQLSQFLSRCQFRQVAVDWSEMAEEAFDFYSSLTGEKAVRIVLSKTNLSRLNELLQHCKERQVTTLIFANPALLNSRRDDYLLDIPSLQEEVKKNVSELIKLSESCQIKMHDLFCEEIMLGKGRREGNFAGCQAGLYLAYVDAEGRVYGCASLPQVIGDLSTASWEEIWRSKERNELRRQLTVRGKACQSCGSYNHCKGGCRGLSWVKYGNFEKPDILCEAIQ